MTDKTTAELASYAIEADHVVAGVKILALGDAVPRYELTVPSLGKATDAMLDHLRDKLAHQVPLIIGAASHEEAANAREQFFLLAKKTVVEEMGALGSDTIAGLLVQRMLGMGTLDILMADGNIEELVINGPRVPIMLYHRKHGWCKTTLLLSDEAILNLSSQIGRKTGYDINSLHPIMDAHLLTGDRVAATMQPVSSFGNTITIRRFARSPWTVVSLLVNKTLTVPVVALLWLAMQYELNIIVAGGTASGKTSMLSALGIFIPPNQRVITIEDTREIALPAALQGNWVALTTRNANPEGQGEISMLHLMVASLRMRPDRIIVGEVRRKEQAETMFEAMHTGHSVYSTMHADTVRQVKRRLIEPPIAIPAVELEALHLVLIQYRDRRRGNRRTLELAEILTGGDEAGTGLEINYLYRWLPRDDVVEKVNDSIRLVEELNLHTGMTPRDIAKDLRDKESILQWMVDKGYADIAVVGSIIQAYYADADRIVALSRTGGRWQGG